MTLPPETDRRLGLNQTISSLVTRRVAMTPNQAAHWEYSQAAGWQSRPWSDVQRRVAALRHGLTSCGLEPGGHVAIMLPTSTAWDDLAMATAGARGVVVGIDPYSSASMVAAISRATMLDVLVVQSETILAQLNAATVSTLRLVVLLEAKLPSSVGAGGVLVLSFGELIARGQGGDSANWDMARPDDPAVIVFTSGTTGEPKAFLYQHRQVCLAAEAILDAFDDLDDQTRVACWLPLSNLFQRMINLAAVALGAQIYFVEDPRTIMSHLPAIRPDVFVGVPRFFEKIEAGIATSINQANRPARAIAFWAMSVGHRRAQAQLKNVRAGAIDRARFWVADRLVLSRIRNAFGGRVRYLVSGSAPMPIWLLERLHAMGLLVLEAYGLSECIVPVAANRLGAFKFGTVGQLMKGIEVKLSSDGELLVKSQGLAQGYLGGEAGLSWRDAQGYMPTGDYASIDEEGFIVLHGRKSEVFKTSTGRRVAPAAIEAALTQAPEIEYAAVFGAGKKAVIAVISVAEGLQRAPAEVIRSSAVASLQDVPLPIRPIGLVITRKPFAIDTGELTTNLKLRRRQVGERYADAIALLYSELESGGAGAQICIPTASLDVEIVGL